MRKKFFDFSLSTAIIVILGYVMVGILTIFTLLDSDNIQYGLLIFTIILVISFIALVIYYGFFPVIISNERVTHIYKVIEFSNLEWDIRRNYRLRYDELVFRDKTFNYKKMPTKIIKKKEIVVQYFPKHMEYLDKYMSSYRGTFGDL